MKTPRRLLIFGFALFLPIAALAASWQRNVTLHGVLFTKVRTDAAGFHVGEIDTETVVGGRACRPGWLHLHPDGTPAAFTAAHEIALPRLTIPAGTWVRQDTAGNITTCAFPTDTTVQGHLCRGTGGPKGVQTAFYPDGALKQFFPVRPTTLDGVPCAPGLVRGAIELHANGRLKSCLLGDTWVHAGRKLRKGTRITLTADGQLQSP
ncbi:hypothetical protein ESB00_05170 [Oleiharenicola lentus]|uniref:WG repeat-containing protein n=1 Tax=Oleiharenicola lentus TaxID=2508720 RepID=A0A4Q1C906_9BACT|nr:hypothetical protein [Oleiharenicola lentus]RXK55291.1 hypothetical protein ESB00_05170 [Oleiharenicola lentus]